MKMQFFRQIIAAVATSATLSALAATSLTLNDGDTLQGVYEDYGITIAAGATVTFNNATVTRTTGSDPAVRCAGDATIILAPGSVNSVDGSATEYAGICIYGYSSGSDTTNTLTIAGTGALTVLGGNQSAGIGSNAYNNGGSAGNIIIAGGTVTAMGGDYAAGIGSGYRGTCGNITISGGNVTADVDRSTSDSTTCTAAIGAGCRGECGNILISGGTIVADAHSGYSRDDACAIGATYYGRCGAITITDGITSVMATKGATAQQHIGQGDGSATVGKVSSLLRFNKEYSNDGKTLTLTPGSDFPTYTITWTNIDGEGTVGTTTVEYGLMPEHAAATKASDADFDNVFAGWVPELAEVESNTTYTAAFCPVPRARSTGGKAEWFFEADGSLRSGAIGNSENTWFRASLPRPCIFTFEWKTSSEGNCDKLGFTVNGEDAYDTAGNKIEPISGVKDNWAEVSVVVSNSLDVLEWKYWKDGSATSGQDCGWIRNFSMAPYEGEVCTLSVVPNHDGEATVNAYAAKDCALGVFPVIARYGYAFLGLFTAAEGGDLVEPPYALSANTTLYAHWAKTTDFDTSDPGAPWTIEDDGITWRTGAIGHNGKTWAEFTVKRPCTITYKWKASTEGDRDPLVFYVDGAEHSRIRGEMTEWENVSLTFEDSVNHVLKWVYSKDDSVTGTYDCGWIRDFVVTPLDSWAVTRNLNYEDAGELETRYVKKGNQLDVSEFPQQDEPREGYTCYWALAPWSGDALTEPVDISADTTLYAHWIKQHGFDEIDTTCQEPWTWLEDGSIRTGKIGDGGETWATISVTGPCDVSFKWKSSSEDRWDKLHFYVDTDHKTDICGVQDDWATYSVAVDSGDHVLKWTYTKDGSGSVGEDCGWIKDVVITAPDSAPYTVTWKNADGTVLETDADLAAGAVSAYNSALPTRAADAQYTYEFAGWTPEFELVSSNTVYTAKYTAALRSYDITWVDENGTELDAQTLYYGTTPEYAGETPTKAATPKYTYMFAGWDPEVATVTGEATYTAKYDATINEYTITWKNYDGSVIDTTTVAYGTVPTHGDATKIKAEDVYNTYAFDHWEPEVVAVTGNAEYQAVYVGTKKWTGSGTEGEPYTLTTPARISEIITLDEGSSSEIYVNVGGDITAESITANLPTGYAVRTTGTAGVVKVVQILEVVWYDDDGSVLRRDEVDAGDMPSYGSTPTKASSAQYDYTFAGWTPEIVAVTTESASYTATYTETLRSYTITWLDADGTQIDTTTVDYGETPVHPRPVSVYTFTRWDPELAAVSSNTTYTAKFSHEVVLNNLTGDYEAAAGDELTGTTTHNVSIPGGATVTINGVSVTGAGGGGATPSPTFNSAGESATTKFVQGEGGKWTLTAFAELSNDALGKDVTADMIKVYAASSIEDLKDADPLASGVEIKERKSAVKTTIEITPPDADSQFFQVKFGEE